MRKVEDSLPVHSHHPKREVDADRSLIAMSEKVTENTPPYLEATRKTATKVLSESTAYPKRTAEKVEDAFHATLSGHPKHRSRKI